MKKFIVRFLGLIILLGVAGFFALRVPVVQDFIVKRVAEQNLVRAGEAQYGQNGLDIVFCGTSSPMGVSDQAQQCFAVFAGDNFFIVDAGAGSAGKVTKFGLPTGGLDGVLLTHFHSDHISALGDLHLMSWVQGRDYQLPLWGGPGVDRVANGINEAFGLDYDYRTGHHGEDILPRAAAGYVATPILASETGLTEIINNDGLVVSVFKVSHPPIEPAYGYRFDYRGRSIVISGDTCQDPNVALASKDADVLIHEVLQPELTQIIADAQIKEGDPRIGELIADTLDYHTSPLEATKVATQANVDLLVFTHFAPVALNALIRDIFTRDIGDYPEDKLVLAQDGLVIRLPGDSEAPPLMNRLPD
jgi:ribonuclease Z